MNTLNFFIELTSCLINGFKLSDEIKEKASFQLFKDAFLLARKHDLGHLFYVAAESLGVLPIGNDENENEFLKAAEKVKYRAIARYVGLDFEVNHINNVLNSACIKHIFLKGTELRSLYPEPWMRTSCDIDVLVHREDLKNAISSLTQEEYICKSGVQFHDVSLFHGMTHLELHHNIMEAVDSMDKVLSQVWNYVIPYDSYQMKMYDSFFVFHQIAHLAYHFTHGGSGFRPFIDIWLLEKQGYDHKEVEELCKKAGINKFYKRIIALNQVLFSGECCTDDDEKIIEYILGIGKYGELEGANELVVRNTGRIKRALHYIFVPYKELVVIYPYAKYRFLVPFYQIRRWIDRIFVQKKRHHAMQKIKKMRRYSKETIKKMRELLIIAGLE